VVLAAAPPDNMLSAPPVLNNATGTGGGATASGVVTPTFMLPRRPLYAAAACHCVRYDTIYGRVKAGAAAADATVAGVQVR